MTDFDDAGEPTPWRNIPSPKYPLNPRREVTDEDLAAYQAKIRNWNHFEELAKLKQRIIDMMLD